MIKDGFKSFASGHTAHAAIGLMLAGLPAAAFTEKPSRRRVVFWGAAAGAALNAFNKELLASHIRTCVVEDLRGGKDEVIDELVATLQKLMK